MYRNWRCEAEYKKLPTVQVRYPKGIDIIRVQDFGAPYERGWQSVDQSAYL
ncbi:hypothetical protein PAV_12c00070 [Paenibacillus alvei DSM 29]|nr:hypothetical protein PAV_12c00070 [Paenibacillus alvei DSM 29]